MYNAMQFNALQIGDPRKYGVMGQWGGFQMYIYYKKLYTPGGTLSQNWKSRENSQIQSSPDCSKDLLNQ